MNFVSVLCTLLILWLSNCAAIQQKVTANDEFVEGWSQIIAYLNQDSGFYQNGADDLMQRYDDELHQLGGQWRTHAKTMITAITPRHEHQFFYDHIAKLNQQELSTLTNRAMASANSVQRARRVIDHIEKHSVLSSKNVHTYDAGEQIGFCFARALMVHYLLLRADVAPNNIVKIFALGDFRIGSQFWHFHVAVLVKTDEGIVVVDPLYGEPAALHDWMANVASLDVKSPLSRARFYLTDPRKYMPSGGFYSIEALSYAEVKPFYSDLGHSFRADSLERSKLFDS